MTASPRCPREHRGSWPDGVPLDRILTEGGGWSCPGILLDGTDCGFELTMAGHPAGREIPEAESLRALIAEILDAVEAVTDRAGMRADIAIWRKRAGLEPS